MSLLIKPHGVCLQSLYSFLLLLSSIEINIDDTNFVNYIVVCIMYILLTLIVCHDIESHVFATY